MRTIQKGATLAGALSLPARLLSRAADRGPRLAVDLAARVQRHTRVCDIAYGDGARRRLDVYAPPEISPGERSPGRAAVVFIHGGGWTSGAKDIYRFLGAALAARGFVTAIPNYTLYPAARFPAFVEDAAEALRWTRDNAGRIGADPARLFVMGHSAGAHIAAMLALDPRWLAGVGLSNGQDLAGMIGLAGIYHFEIETDTMRGIFGAPADKAHTQPLAHATREAPPLLLATGDADETVGPQNTRVLAEAVRGAGGRVETIFYPRLKHREIVGAFSPLFRFLAPVADDVAAFVSTKTALADNTARHNGGRERGPDERVL